MEKRWFHPHSNSWHNLLKVSRLWKFIPILALSGVVLACEEVVNPVLISAAPVLVVDSWITDREGESKVLLTTTAPFSSPEVTPRVSGATVSISDGSGNNYMFLEDRPGVYLPADEGFKGVTGIAYTLRVVYEENEYSSFSRMPQAPNIDSLTYRLRKDDLFFEDGYYLVCHFQEPPGIRNFYFWNIYINGVLFNNDEIIINDDATLDGLYLNYELPVFIPTDAVEEGDSVRVDMFALTQAAFNYYQGLILLTEAGSPSQAVPENPSSNVRGGALGFFNVSSVNSATKPIEKD